MCGRQFFVLDLDRHFVDTGMKLLNSLKSIPYSFEADNKCFQFFKLDYFVEKNIRKF